MNNECPEHEDEIKLYCPRCVEAIEKQSVEAERKRILENHLEFLAFIQKQMEDRRSKNENEIGRDERSTTEYLILSLCWQEHLRVYFGLYPALDAKKPIGSGKNAELWIKVKEYRERLLEG